MECFLRVGNLGDRAGRYVQHVNGSRRIRQEYVREQTGSQDAAPGRQYVRPGGELGERYFNRKEV